MSVENAAANILSRGVELDTKKRFTEALVCYQEGLQLLIDSMKNEKNDQRKTLLRGKIETYIKRAETIKQHIEHQKTEGKFHEQIEIMNNSTGNGYSQIFGRFLDPDVTSVIVEDPYIRNFHQCQNFLRFCELVVKKCTNLKTITLVTSTSREKDQMDWFQGIRCGLFQANVELCVEISDTLHDRQIKLSSGWIIKIGRGLDYFKPPEGKMSLGYFDLDLRPCHETTVDIFHSKDIHKRS